MQYVNYSMGNYMMLWLESMIEHQKHLMFCKSNRGFQLSTTEPVGHFVSQSHNINTQQRTLLAHQELTAWEPHACLIQ